MGALFRSKFFPLRLTSIFKLQLIPLALLEHSELPIPIEFLEVLVRKSENSMENVEGKKSEILKWKMSSNQGYLFPF